MGALTEILIFTFTVFGDPSLDSNWALRYEGHHLAYNWTFVSGVGIASSPQFFGSNPAEVKVGIKRALEFAAEEDLGRDLVSSLSGDQKSTAILDIDVPGDIFTAAERNFASRKFWRKVPRSGFSAKKNVNCTD